MLHHIPYMQTLSLVCQALRNKRVVDFISTVLIRSYQYRFADHYNDVIDLIERSLHLLVESQENKLSISGLQKAGRQCNQGIFKTHDRSEWFEKSYLDYRSNLKTRYEYSTIQKYLLPGTVLDFGSGDGYFAEFLTNIGFSVWGTDIRDYRSPHSVDFNFSLMRTPLDLDSVPAQFDNTIVKSVLHHVDSKYIDQDITLLRKKTLKRLIIKEEMLSVGENNIHTIDSPNESFMSTYRKLSREDQLHYLALMDFFGNYVVQGLFFINLPFNFHALSQWETVLNKHGLSVIDTIPKMFDVEMFHPGPHVWLICDVVQ